MPDSASKPEQNERPAGPTLKRGDIVRRRGAFYVVTAALDGTPRIGVYAATTGVSYKTDRKAFIDGAEVLQTGREAIEAMDIVDQMAGQTWRIGPRRAERDALQAWVEERDARIASEKDDVARRQKAADDRAAGVKP